MQALTMASNNAFILLRRPKRGRGAAAEAH